MLEDLQVARAAGRKVGGRDAALQRTALPASRVLLQQKYCYNTPLWHRVVVQLRATTVLLPLQLLQLERCFNLVECRRTVVPWVRVTASGLHFTTAKHTQQCFRSGGVKPPISMTLPSNVETSMSFSTEYDFNGGEYEITEEFALQQ